MKDAVKSELDRLDEMGVLERVSHSSANCGCSKGWWHRMTVWRL